MADTDKISLVHRPSSGVEKAAPGAKRILSGMVKDTLAIVAAKTKTEPTEAEDWLEKGNRYWKTEDYTEAVVWYRKAAEHGHADAQAYLGLCYQTGFGVTNENVKSNAVTWYRKAAATGNILAIHNLAVCYFWGLGAEPNYSEATKLFLGLAKQGHPTAQYNLSLAFLYGIGVSSDLREAYKWVNLAARQGDTSALKELESMKVLLSPELFKESDIATAANHQRFVPLLAPDHLKTLNFHGERKTIEFGFVFTKAVPHS